MYVPTLRRPLGDLVPSVNPTPWVAGALLLVAAVVVTGLDRRLRRAR